MKAITAVCPTGAAVVNGRVSRRTSSSTASSANNGENAEIKMYLSKLKDLVPFMPKNRKLSKLEIIQHVIDYICDLQSELETNPIANNFDPTTVLNELQNDERLTSDSQINNINNSNSNNSNSINGIINHSTSQNIRQPLVDRSTPNLILTSPQFLPSTTSVVHYQQQNSFHHSSHTTNEKMNFDVNSRT